VDDIVLTKGQRLGIIGMSYALGLASRTSYYHRTTWGPLGKMGRVQGASEYGTLSTLMVTTAHRPESFDEGILRKYALFWIDPDEKVFHDLPVPSGAVYAVESIAILITKSWESSTSSIVQEAVSLLVNCRLTYSYTPPRHQPLERHRRSSGLIATAGISTVLLCTNPRYRYKMPEG
jgi:hypothetical protein